MPAAARATPERRSVVPPPEPPRSPLHHHPVVALSVMLIVASAAQVTAWLFRHDPAITTAAPCSSLIVHDLVYRPAVQWIEARIPDSLAAARVVFFAHMTVCLLSAAAWYTAVYLAFGAGWAFWTAAFWVAHPLFAITAQRPGAMGLTMLAVAGSWMLLTWWARSAGLRVAFIAGLSWGLTLFTSLLPLLLAPFLLIGILFSPPVLARRLAATLLFATAFLLPAAAGWGLLRTSGQSSAFRGRLEIDLWNRIDVADGSSMSRAARAVRAARSPESPGPGPVAFLGSQVLRAPGDSAWWLARRFVLAPVSGSGAAPGGPMALLQWSALLPAAWGLLVALRLRPWRWATATGATMSLLVWGWAALVDPRARALAPVCAFAVTLAIIGMADLYERVFGRRLIPSR